MSGTRAGWVRVVAMGFALAVTMLLFAARDAGAAKYAVAQCGWHLGADASWADTTGGAKFRPDAWCATPAGADPFDGAHMKSFTKNAPTVSGNRYARWRWAAPPTTGITRVSGTWWHALHDGMQQRIGSLDWGGGFHPFAVAGSTDVALRGFAAGFSSPRAAIEDRLLCARGTDKWCSLAATSWSAVRALTITVQDDVPPAAGLDGPLTTGGWQRGSRSVGFWGNDAGAGVHLGETTVDGARVALAEYACAKVSIGGEWRGARMQPCPTKASGGERVDTARFSDGTHVLRHCAFDFAGNAGCPAGRKIRIDNNPPAAPRGLALAGGEEWRRVNDFDLSWSNPGQGKASPIDAARWRITGPDGYDSGEKTTGGHDIEDLRNRTVPRPGVFRIRVWLRDEAGNSKSSSNAQATMRLDYVAPGVAFEPVEGRSSSRLPDKVVAAVFDEHSGPARGEVRYRRLGTDRWRRLPAELKRGEKPGRARLVASVPDDLRPGTYLFRAEAVDGAGNEAASTRRADGTQMALRKLPEARPVSAAARAPAATAAGGGPRSRAKTRIFARLRRGRGRGRTVTTPFGAGARLGGRLLTAGGAGLANRKLRIVSRFSRGSFRRKRVETVRTGKRGGFRLTLRPGPSRRITARFHGAPGLAPSRRAGLSLRVRGGLSLAAAPRTLRTGETLRLRGRVRSRGAPLPRRGKLVAVQYFEGEARRWRPVLVTRSDHGGRFHARYRFRYVSGRARIRLRAVALAEERWPYAPGASRPLTVRVSG
jgi:hypothetical protein